MEAPSRAGLGARRALAPAWGGGGGAARWERGRGDQFIFHLAGWSMFPISSNGLAECPWHACEEIVKGDGYHMTLDLALYNL